MTTHQDKKIYDKVPSLYGAFKCTIDEKKYEKKITVNEKVEQKIIVQKTLSSIATSQNSLPLSYKIWGFEETSKTIPYSLQNSQSTAVATHLYINFTGEDSYYFLMTTTDGSYVYISDSIISSSVFDINPGQSANGTMTIVPKHKHKNDNIVVNITTHESDPSFQGTFRADFYYNKIKGTPIVTFSFMYA
jgi:formylmethanofuran dehydrogenase subunit E-like metal-binding protein